MNKLEQIEKLATLKEQGVLTDEEFQKQKTVLLKSIEVENSKCISSTSSIFQIKEGITSISFANSKGILKRRMVFSDQNNRPVYWASEDAAFDDKISIYEDETGIRPIATLTKRGIGSRLWSEVLVNDERGANNLGSVKWDGGVTVTRWIIRTIDDREIRCDEKSAGFIKRLGRTIYDIVATVVYVMPFSKSGSLSLSTEGNEFGIIRARLGIFIKLLCVCTFGLMVLILPGWRRKYTIENVQYISEQVDLRLVLATMSLQGIVSNRTF